MDKNEIIERLGEIAKHSVHTIGEEPFIMSLDDGTAVYEAIDIIQQSQSQSHWISCSDASTLTKDRTFWVTHMNGYEAWVGELYWDMTEWSDRVSDVVAYMPCNIPEPYQEGE